MRVVHAAIALPLAVLAVACSRENPGRVTAPEPPESRRPAIVQARWVWDRASLSAAIHRARQSPLVQRAFEDLPLAGVQPEHDLAVRAVGTDERGVSIAVTIVPYSVLGDPTRAVFVSFLERSGQEGAEVAEMIAGRDPMPHETGFQSAVWADRAVWIRTNAAYVTAPAGALRAPMRRNFGRLFACLADRMPAGCAAGAAIGREISGHPAAAAIGCGVGAAVGAATCALDFFAK